MRALFTNCCGVEWRRINSSSFSRAGDSKMIGAGFGPGISFLIFLLWGRCHGLCIVYPKTHLLAYLSRCVLVLAEVVFLPFVHSS